MLLFVFPILVSAQKRCFVDTIFLNTSSSDFFLQNPVVDSLKVNGYPYNSAGVWVYSKTFWQDTSYHKLSFYGNENYDFDFLGDKYLFEKKYGGIDLPEEEMSVVLGKKYIAPTFHFIIRPDSIRRIIEYYCPEEKDDNEEKVFTKVEVLARYKNGIKQLQSQMEHAFKESLTGIKCSRLDSVLIYKILVDSKDSCLKRIELIEGRYSPFEELIMEELKRSCSWLPSMQGGRAVMSYIKIFIRLNKDRSITVDL
ncbi:MAG: hypothetical protein LH478_01630 [Chitinophagaceae bacterium]|nr:hypothetical protein [Chitinophagaceae bacterium]